MVRTKGMGGHSRPHHGKTNDWLTPPAIGYRAHRTRDEAGEYDDNDPMVLVERTDGKQWYGADEPLPTNTTANHMGLVYSFLVKYFGTAIGVEVDSPAPTLTGKDRFGLVTVTIDGQLYVIADIGMRMLTPRELARAQGFPDTYILTGTKTSQVAKIGNSVCPHVAAAIVRANCRAEVAAHA